jgi:hypothetical protein
LSEVTPYYIITLLKIIKKFWRKIKMKNKVKAIMDAYVKIFNVNNGKLDITDTEVVDRETFNIVRHYDVGNSFKPELIRLIGIGEKVIADVSSALISESYIESYDDSIAFDISAITYIKAAVIDIKDKMWIYAKEFENDHRDPEIVDAFYLAIITCRKAERLCDSILKILREISLTKSKNTETARSN